MSERNWEADYKSAMDTVADLQKRLDEALQQQADIRAVHEAKLGEVLKQHAEATAAHEQRVAAVKADVEAQLGTEIKRLKTAFLQEQHARAQEALAAQHAEALRSL